MADRKQSPFEQIIRAYYPPVPKAGAIVCRKLKQVPLPEVLLKQLRDRLNRFSTIKTRYGTTTYKRVGGVLHYTCEGKPGTDRVKVKHTNYTFSQIDASRKTITFPDRKTLRFTKNGINFIRGTWTLYTRQSPVVLHAATLKRFLGKELWERLETILSRRVEMYGIKFYARKSGDHGDIITVEGVPVRVKVNYNEINIADGFISIKGEVGSSTITCKRVGFPAWTLKTKENTEFQKVPKFSQIVKHLRTHEGADLGFPPLTPPAAEPDA